MLIVTDGAVLRIKEMMKEANQSQLRFGVVGGGCTGLSYIIGFAEEVLEKDTILQCNGIDVVIGKEELPIVKGTVIDYKESMMGGGFTIDNPNAIASCGCGSSFRTKEVSGKPNSCD